MVETFGQRLRRLREDAELSQSKLAALVPISQSSLSRYESGHQTVDDPHVADRLDELLKADGSLRALRPETAAEITLTPDDRARIAHHIEYPAQIDHATVTALANVLAAQRRLDDTLGPDLIIPSTLTQLRIVTGMVTHARGPHRDELLEVAAEYVQFGGWLHAEARRDSEAAHLLTEAEHLADETGNGILAAQALNFRGYLARQRGNARGVVCWFLAAHHTLGAHIAQRVGDAAQAAQGYARLGQRDNALRLLDVAGALLDVAARAEPPASAYWLTPTYHRLNFGIAALSLADYSAAVDHISAGLDGLPEDQQDAEWTTEYRDAREVARSAS